MSFRKQGTIDHGRYDGIPCVKVLLVLGMIISIRAWSDPSPGAAASHQVTLVVTEVALISLSDAGPLELTVDASGSSALPAGARDTGSKRLFYTMVNCHGSTRTIMVQWVPTDTAPAGTSLRIRAVSVPAGCGWEAGEVTISSIPQALICVIPTCATGTGGSGVELRYRFVVDNPTRAIAEDRQTVTIIFTVRDDS